MHIKVSAGYPPLMCPILIKSVLVIYLSSIRDIAGVQYALLCHNDNTILYSPSFPPIG